MFFGEFEYKIDEKGRIPIPPKFRRELGKEEVVLTSFAENCITAYPLPEWKKLADNTITSGPVPQNKLRRLNRAIFAAAFSLTIDGQGRISLPASLRQKAGIDDEVIVAGANNYFELWNKEQWGSEKADSQEQAWQIIESLENR
jgi:MraZ protein